MRNRIRLLVIALLAVLSLAACGNEGSGTATVNMKQLQQAMLAAAPSLSETASTTGDAADAKETFSYVSDLPYDKVENFLLSYSTTGKADEIAVIAVKDSADVTKARRLPPGPCGKPPKALPAIWSRRSCPGGKSPGFYQGSICRFDHLRR